MSAKYLYHLTDKESLPDILEHGLIQQIGPRSASVDEPEPRIFLCRRRDVPYWRIIIDQHVVLQVECDSPDIEKAVYDRYQEFMIQKPIPPDKIRRVYIYADENKVMRDLCTSYLYSFSHICVDFARYYNGADFVDKDRLSMQMNSLRNITSRLDYSVLSKKEIRDELRDHGENGGFTLCDRYLNTETRLWEQLIRYPNDSFTPDREWLYTYIRKTFKGCLSVDTGGWWEYFCDI